MNKKLEIIKILSLIILILGVTGLIFHAETPKINKPKIYSCPINYSQMIILTDEQKIKEMPYGSTVWAIYGVESGFGKNDWCRSRGGFNGYGYAIPNCYKSVEEISLLVSAWLYNEMKVKGLNFYEATCLYNSGKISEDCDYAHKVLYFDTITPIAI
jgi:hypothetical protein